MRLRYGTINVPAGVGPEAWASCFTALAERAWLFGINENLVRGQRLTYRSMAKKHGYASFGTGSPNPVFWDPKRFVLVGARVHELHGLGPLWWFRRWRGFNAARYATVVILRDRETGMEVVAINTHWVPRGRKVADWWREWARKRSRLKVARLVRHHVRRGRVVVPMGDFNIGEPFDLISGHRWVVGHGVDKLGFAPARRLEAVVDVDRFEADTDHKHGIAVEVTIAA